MSIHNITSIAANTERMRDLQRVAEQNRLAGSMEHPSIMQHARQTLGRTLIAAGQHLTNDV